jgi:hypothetical protein
MANEANIIKIKRSGTSGAPASLKLGELAYSYLTATGNPTSNGGDRLFIGANGVGVSGNANDVIVIGGKYFTDMLDHERGILTASSALIVDGNKKLDELLVDNLSLNGNTIISTDTNGNINITPDGTGKTVITNLYIGDTSTSLQEYIYDQVGGTITAGSGIDVTFSDVGNTTTIAVNTEYAQDLIGAMVSGNSETNITVTYDDPNGKLDFSVATASSSVLGVAKFSPSYFTVTSGDVAINDATSTTKGIASFNSTDFTVTSGAVTVNAERIEDIIGAMVSSNNETNITVTYDDPNGKLDFSVATATSSVLGVASFDSTDFTVTAGAVTVNEERIQDIVGAMVAGTETDLAATYNDPAGTLDFTLNTVNTNVGSFGSSTAIPVITVNAKGLVTAVTTATISTTLNIAGDTGTDGVSLGSDTLTVAGSGAISTAVTDNRIAISVATATSSVKGVATFNTSGFVVTSGDVALKTNVAQSISGDTGSAIPATNAFTIAGTSAQGIVTSATGSTVTVTASNATSSQKGVATFNTASFTVTSGDVTIKSAGVSNAQLANSSVTVGSTSISLGASATTIAGLTQVDVNNIRITGNTISSTDTNGNINLAPNGTGTIDAGNVRITNLADPTGAQDAATKAYVDAVKTGLDVKGSVRAATTANITLTNTQTIDSVALSVGDRVLVKNQTTASQNGIYVVASGAWTRATDCDNTPGTEVTSGLFTFVEEGTAYADSGWVLTTDGTITLGTTSLSFVQFSGAGQITAGEGLSKTGNTLDVNVANGIEIVGDNVQLASTVAGAGLTYTSGVLDIVGTSNRITVNADSIDISTSYVGQNTITTLGTITTGTWNGSVVGPTYGGTGINNGSNTITIGGNVSTGGAVSFSGAYAFTGTLTAATSVTFPTTGTLVNTAVTTLSSLTSIGTIGTGVWQGTEIASGYGGTGFKTYAKGDLLYASAANTLSKLTAGTNGQMLQLQDGLPVWADMDGGTY